MKKNNEISNLIAREFDGRMEAAVFSHILDKGMENLAKITEQEIEKIEGNGIMSKDFLQALVRTAVKICKNYTPIEVMKYIRTECGFTPFPSHVTLYKDTYSASDWMELCCMLDEDENEAEIKILVIKESEEIY